MNTICNNRAAYRYTWLGRDEKLVCADCARKLKSYAEAMGFHLQLLPLSPNSVVNCSARKDYTE